MSEERRDKTPGRPENGRGIAVNGAANGNGAPGGPGSGGEARPDDGNRDKRRFGRRRFGRGNTQSQGGSGETREEAHPDTQASPQPRPEPVACPICGKPVYDLSTALSSDRENPTPAHFDCVLERVTAAESLGPAEKIVYLGSGAFGVVEFKDKSEALFAVKRRIQWEKEGDKQDWRRSLSSRISNL